MFTGIIQYILVIDIDLVKKQIVLYAGSEFLEKLSLGCSVAIDGVCLTVVEIGTSCCKFDLSEETIRKTYMNVFQVSAIQTTLANVELAMKQEDRLNGHVVSGHVFSTGSVISFDQQELVIKLNPDDITRVTYKGSITINGISLTVAKIEGNNIHIWIIPETLNRTTIKHFKPNQIVNLEFDLTDYNREKRDHSFFMRLAKSQAELGRYTTFPNPWVGCVIVKNGQIISQGHHQKAGEDHAEVVAINGLQIDDRKSLLQGATLYCTLEPCNHLETLCYPNPCCHETCLLGQRSDSCANTIIKYGITTVVVGIVDPDVRVAGKGIEKLRNNGIQVILIEEVDKKLHSEISFSLRSYIHQRKTGMPYIVAKIALTADGCYHNDSQKWITHEGSRQELYKIWNQSQAIILGAMTVQKDNPELKFSDFPGMDNRETTFRKVVIDGNCLTSANHKIFQEPVQIVTSHPKKWGDLETISVNDTKDMKNVIDKICEKNPNMFQILVEGGGALHHSFFEAGLVNEIVIFRGSKIFGKTGYRWEIPEVNIELHDVRTILSSEGEINILERYLVTNDIKKQEEIKEERFDPLDLALQEFERGGSVIVMDDESRENEGDLVVAASMMTQRQMTDFINNTSGIICAPMDTATANKLNLPLTYIPGQNTDRNGTPFAKTVDHKNTTTGISSQDRLMTVRALADPSTIPTDLNRPGHIFPLIANPSGLAARRGHTEASVALCQLTNFHPPVAVIGELKNYDGTIKNRRDCFVYARNNSIPIISIEQISQAMEKRDYPKILASCDLKLKYGDREWKQICFDAGNQNLNIAHTVLVYPATQENLGVNDVPTRIHSECFTGDVLKSELCDCGNQLKSAMKYIVNTGYGIIVFPSEHEGRGIGRVHKCKAYDLKKKLNINTFEANQRLGFSDDARTYYDIPKILTKLGVTKIKLLTENPNKVNVFSNSSISVTEVIPMISEYNIHSDKYLSDKREMFDTLVLDNSTGKREKNMNKAFSEVDNIERNSKYRIGIVYSEWHAPLIERIRNKLKYHLNNLGVTQIEEFKVPGAAELSFGAASIARRNLENSEDKLALLTNDRKSSKIDGVIVVGILIKGDTYHFEGVASGVFANVGNVRDNMNLPIINATMACLNYQQVEERIDGHKSTIEYLARSLIQLIVNY